MFMDASNQVTLIGRLCDDPTFFGRKAQGARLILGVHRPVMEDGKRPERGDCFQVVCWKGLVKSCRHLAAGDRVAVAGVLRTRVWGDQHGDTHVVTEVHAADLEFLEVKSRREAKGA